MTAKKQKYYVVWLGHNPGVYASWTAAEAQVRNYPNARYKSYPTKTEAEVAFRHGPSAAEGPKKKPAPPGIKTKIGVIENSISVDAACSGNPGLMEYRGVRTADHTELFHLGPFEEGTNNIGEFLAIVHALAMLKKEGDATTPIYTDSRTALSWIARKKANTKLERTRKNTALFDLIRRAEVWLDQHQWSNKVLKWNTEQWGEIPADFGRK